MPRVRQRYVIVCDEYRTEPFTHLNQAEAVAASINRDGPCPLSHHVEEA